MEVLSFLCLEDVYLVPVCTSHLSLCKVNLCCGQQCSAFRTYLLFCSYYVAAENKVPWQNMCTTSNLRFLTLCAKIGFARIPETQPGCSLTPRICVPTLFPLSESWVWFCFWNTPPPCVSLDPINTWLSLVLVMRTMWFLQPEGQA